MARNLFKHETRDSSTYRAQRLEEERERLHRRLLWAVERSDQKAVQWLEKRLDDLEHDLDADLEPGRQPGRHDSHRRWRW